MYIIEINGKKIIADGNHRWCSSMCAGLDDVLVEYLDAEEYAAKKEISLETLYNKAHQGKGFERMWPVWDDDLLPPSWR